MFLGRLSSTDQTKSCQNNSSQRLEALESILTKRPSANVLFSDKTPLAVTILVAAMGWCITHFVNRIENSPTIEYSVVKKTISSNKIEYKIELRNLSLNKSFEDLDFVIRKIDPTDRSFDFLPNPEINKVIAHAPTLVVQTVKFGLEGAQFNLKEFPPEGRVDLIVFCNGSCEKVVFQGKANNGVAMRLVKRNFETFLVQNQLIVSMLLLIAMTIPLIWFA